LVSCRSDRETGELNPDRSDALRDGYVTHPTDEKLPHNDVESNKLEINSDFSKVDTIPNQLKYLHHFLTDSTMYDDIVKLSFLVNDQDAIYAEALDVGNLILLDQRDDRLVHYNLESHEYIKIAPKGRGPGDLAFTQELQLHDDKIFVGMQGYRLSVFDCIENPCKYEETIITDFNIYSIAPSNHKLAIIGLLPFGRENDLNSKDVDEFAVHMIDESGEIEKSFNPVYQDKFPAVRERVNAHGSVRFFEKTETYAVLFNKLPYIYIYDQTGNLDVKYKIPDFEQRLFDFHEGDMMGRERYHRDNSYITHAEKVDDEWLLITVRERKKLFWEDRTLHFDEAYIYLGFYLPDEKLFEIGRDKIRPHTDRKVIYPTDYGLLVTRNEVSYWVSNSQ